MKSLNVRISIGLLLLVLILPSAYLVERLSKDKALESGAMIKVQDKLAGSLVALMGVDVLKSLMAQQYPGDSDAKGPTLLYTIGASGLSGWHTVEVKGLQKGRALLDKRNLGSSYVLSFNQRGTVDLIDLNQQGVPIVQDVSEINKTD